jgi:CelD/BcsL family acetyltransferase involved in cellulose biosynthesis
MPQIVLSRPEELATPAGWARLGERWRALEAESECSFFQSWSWVGCLGAERFPDPVLLEAREAGETVALALFNRRRGVLGSSLHLNETGDGTHDAPFVEHNGLLVRRGFEPVVAPCLAAALHGFGRRVVLGGVGEKLAAAGREAPGCAVVRQIRPAPYVDLAAVRAAGGGYEAGLSSNTRQQLRRSARGYGAIRAVRAADVAEGLDFLDSLATLHQTYWTGRGQAGAFAAPFFRAFHRELVTIALPRGEIELWRVAADGDNILGYLYNFRWRDQIAAYQSGFSYPRDDSRRKPGLTSHKAAVEFALAEGLSVYDFLGGGDRYKTSLGNSRRDLHWLELGPCWRPAALLARLST